MFFMELIPSANDLFLYKVDLSATKATDSSYKIGLTNNGENPFKNHFTNYLDNSNFLLSFQNKPGATYYRGFSAFDLATGAYYWRYEESSNAAKYVGMPAFEQQTGSTAAAAAFCFS